jgi:hypothetical protein
MTNHEAIEQIENALQGARKIDSPSSHRWAAALEVAISSIRTADTLNRAGIKIEPFAKTD